MALIIEAEGPDITMEAEEAITVGKAVKVGAADGKVLLATATSSIVIGVSRTAAAAAGDKIVVRLVGPVVTVTAQGTVTRGARVMWATGAKALDVSGNVQSFGISLASVTTDGDQFPCVLQSVPCGTA